MLRRCFPSSYLPLLFREWGQSKSFVLATRRVQFGPDLHSCALQSLQVNQLRPDLLYVPRERNEEGCYGSHFDQMLYFH
jgi:hypothetical protein